MDQHGGDDGEGDRRPQPAVRKDGVLAGGVRWTTCALTDNLELIYAAQLLHGAVVTGLLVGGPLYLEQVVPDRLRSTAQGILAKETAAMKEIEAGTVDRAWVDKSLKEKGYNV